MITKALIPVRAGSQRVINKNIRPFAGSSLLEIKIKQLKKMDFIESVVVNSDSDEMLELSRSLGAETVKRDKYYASNDVPMNEVYKNIASNIDCDLIIFADVTNPLIEDNTIINCFNVYKNNNSKYDSLITVNLVKQFMWFNGKPINYNPEKKPKSQDLPDIMALNHAISIIPKSIMVNKMDIVGYNPYFYVTDSIEGTDIDNEVDFKFTEFLYLNKTTGGGYNVVFYFNNLYIIYKILLLYIYKLLFLF